MGRFNLLAVALALLVLSACSGGDEEPTPAPTPEVAPAVTPDETPAPEPVALAPLELFHVVVEEVVSAPPLPSRSPLARDLGVGPDGVPTSQYLAWDEASTDVWEAVSSLESGYGVPGSALALVEWRIRWGDAGATRRWALCALPCTVEEKFVATPAHHPVHPLKTPRALFAFRPGAESLLIEATDDGVSVLHGDTALWADGQAAEPVEGSAPVTIPVLLANGVASADWSWTANRRLRAVEVGSKTFELHAAADPVPSTTRALPRLKPRPAAPRLLAVEGLAERWAWPEAEEFEGGFTAKPNPADYGLKLDRIAQEVRWYPTARQAGEGKARFDTYTLTRQQGSMSISPFPDGGDVLAAITAVEKRVVVVSPSGFEADPRASEVASLLEHYQTVLPLAGTDEDRPDPWVLYSVEHPTGAVAGSAGPRLFALTVDRSLGEKWSVARAWSRLLLAPHIAASSEASEDFIAWAMSKLDDDRPDRSVYMHTFIGAGDDIEEVWLQWLVDPDRKGGADPAAFLALVEAQLPDLAEQLRRDLAIRRFATRSLPESVEFEPGTRVWSQQVTELGAAGHVVAVRLPEGASHDPVTIKVSPEGRGRVHWIPKLVAERYWEEAMADTGAQEYLTQGLPPTVGTARPEPEATPAAPPSQLAAVQGARVRTKPKAADPTTTTESHPDKPAGRSTVLVFLWGLPGSTATVRVEASVAAPELPPEPEPEPEPEAPAEQEAGE